MSNQTGRCTNLPLFHWLSSSVRHFVLTAIFSLVALSPTRLAAQTVGFFPPASLSSGSAIRSGVSDPVSNSLGHVAVGFGHSVWFAGDQLYGAAQVLVYGASLGNWFLPNPPTHPASAAYNELVSTRGSHLAAAGSYYWENLPNWVTLGFWSGAQAAYTDYSNFFNGRPYEGRVAYFTGGFLGGLATGRAMCAPFARGGTKGGRGAANAASADAAGLERPTQGVSPGKPRGGPPAAFELGDTNFESRAPFVTAELEPNSATLVKWPPKPDSPGLVGHGGVVLVNEYGRVMLVHLQKDPHTGSVGIQFIQLREFTRPADSGASYRGPRVWKKCSKIPTEEMNALEDRAMHDMFAGRRDGAGLYTSFLDVLKTLEEGGSVDPMSNCNSYAMTFFGLCQEAAKTK